MTTSLHRSEDRVHLRGKRGNRVLRGGIGDRCDGIGRRAGGIVSQGGDRCNVRLGQGAGKALAHDLILSIVGREAAWRPPRQASSTRTPVYVPSLSVAPPPATSRSSMMDARRRFMPDTPAATSAAV